MSRLTGDQPDLLRNLWSRQDRACIGKPTEYWCPPDEVTGPNGETLPLRPTERAELLAKGKTICFSCPAMDECRTYARKALEEGGVWGGEDEDERADALYNEWVRDEGLEVAA